MDRIDRPVRFVVLTTLVVVAAVLLWYAMFSDDVARAREACLARGGQVVIESDAQSIGHVCVFPDGTREKL